MIWGYYNQDLRHTCKERPFMCGSWTPFKWFISGFRPYIEDIAPTKNKYKNSVNNIFVFGSSPNPLYKPVYGPGVKLNSHTNVF